MSSLPSAACRDCGADLNAATGAYDVTADPDPGDVSVCLYCGCLSIFTEVLLLRAPTDAEYQQLAQDQNIVRVLQARARVS